jgi:hypothetical protein
MLHISIAIFTDVKWIQERSTSNINRFKISKEDAMQQNINNSEENKFKKEMQQSKAPAGEKIDTSKLEAEGACEIIEGKDEEAVCNVKS